MTSSSKRLNVLFSRFFVRCSGSKCDGSDAPSRRAGLSNDRVQPAIRNLRTNHLLSLAIDRQTSYSIDGSWVLSLCKPLHVRDRRGELANY